MKNKMTQPTKRDLAIAEPVTDAYRANYDAIFRLEPQPNPDWPAEAEDRMDLIGQNGNTGEHYL